MLTIGIKQVDGQGGADIYDTNGALRLEMVRTDYRDEAVYAQTPRFRIPRGNRACTALSFDEFRRAAATLSRRCDQSLVDARIRYACHDDALDSRSCRKHSPAEILRAPLCMSRGALALQLAVLELRPLYTRVADIDQQMEAWLLGHWGDPRERPKLRAC